MSEPAHRRPSPEAAIPVALSRFIFLKLPDNNEMDFLLPRVFEIR